MIQVHIADQQDYLAVDSELVRSAVTAALQAEGLASAEVSVAVLDDAAIRPLNRQYLGHDWATDCISFRLDDADSNSAAGDSDQPALVGEVIVSAETAVREAARLDWPPKHELVLYLVHATLHLAGYDDVADEDRQKMRQREREVLSSLGISIPTQAAVDHEATQEERSSS